jgi:hypothetical protein
MKPGNLSRGEVIAMVGGGLLAISIFVSWYGTTADNPNSKINGVHQGAFSAWQTHSMLRWLLLAAAAAPFILAWIVVREHQLSWPRGELTAIVAIAAAGFILYTGLIQKPGDPPATIGLAWGWFLSLVAALLLLAGAFMRSTETAKSRKPPGVL